jgi:hypothetical protein
MVRYGDKLRMAERKGRKHLRGAIQRSAAHKFAPPERKEATSEPASLSPLIFRHQFASYREAIILFRWSTQHIPIASHTYPCKQTRCQRGCVSIWKVMHLKISISFRLYETKNGCFCFWLGKNEWLSE